MKIQQSDSSSENQSAYFEGKSHSTSRPNQRVRDTSKSAIKEHSKSGKLKTGKEQVYRSIVDYGSPMSRNMISTESGFAINYVTKYVSLLIKEGKLLESVDKMPCLNTGSNVYFLTPNIKD